MFEFPIQHSPSSDYKASLPYLCTESNRCLFCNYHSIIKIYYNVILTVSNKYYPFYPINCCVHCRRNFVCVVHQYPRRRLMVNLKTKQLYDYDVLHGTKFYDYTGFEIEIIKRSKNELLNK